MEATLAQNEAHLKRLDADFRRVSRTSSAGAMPHTGRVRQEHEVIARKPRTAVGIASASRDLAQLSFTRVEAAISGRLSRRLVDPWNLVKADETTLTTIVSLDPLYVYFDVPDERTMLRLRRLTQEGRMPSREEGKYRSEADAFRMRRTATARRSSHIQERHQFQRKQGRPQYGYLRVRGLDR